MHKQDHVPPNSKPGLSRGSSEVELTLIIGVDIRSVTRWVICGAHKMSSSSISRSMLLGASDAFTMAKARKAVRFGKVQIRPYDMILGDNPATRKGLPVTIDWDHYDPVVRLLDDHEESKQKKPARLKTDYRRIYLSSLGMYSATDFVYALVEIQ
jgi:hypothetical protein